MDVTTDYRATLNLPKTEFPMKADLPVREPQRLDQWRQLRLYDAVRRQRANARLFVLHDGPPYANGDIHIGHALNKTLKDIIVKYRTMRGYDAPYVPGWDCHGLPIEYQLLKELGIEKHQVDRVRFRQQARAFAKKFVDVQSAQFQRLGIFGEWERSYLTMTPEYEAAIVETFFRLRSAGYIYRGKKPVYWCTRCETALAEAEVEYQDREDRSIYVLFPVVSLSGDQAALPASVLVWTTTPWTLPANRALCFHPESKYAVVEVTVQGAAHRVIVVESRVTAISALLGDASPRIVAHVSGAAFAKGQFQPPFGATPVPGVTDQGVNLDEGTGVIHIAPGHGHEDYLIGQRHGLETFSPVDHQGKLAAVVSQFAGQSIFAANPKIIADLKGRGLLLKEAPITHSYPHCWRCGQPVIFRATEQWFLNVEHEELRQRLLRETERVQWVPSYGANRIRGMIEARPDWCLSRQRYWGTPIPVLYCIPCGREIRDERLDAAIVDAVKRDGSDWWFQLGGAADVVERLQQQLKHEGKLPVCCLHCDNRSQFRIEEDILDVWFDSGVSHEAVLQRHDNWWPADLYLEGSDQHRGWFQASLIPAVALRDQAPYRGVFTHGFVVDGDGKKMSKSAGNVISPQQVITKHGADVLRLWVAGCDYREDIRLSDEILRRSIEAYRKIRNSCRFILGNVHGFDPARGAVPVERMQLLDRWALDRLARLIDVVTEAYEAYEFHRVFRALYDFCNEDLSACYLDALKDRLYTSVSDGEARRSAQTVLRRVLEAMAQMMAPILPFTAEEVWQHLGNSESVHLAGWPSAGDGRLSSEEAASWDEVLAVRSVVLKALEEERMAKRIGDPLEAEVVLVTEDARARTLLTTYRQPLEELCVVSRLRVAEPSTASGGAASRTATGEGATTRLADRVSVAVTKAPGEKCPRCWRWSTDIGEISAHSELCRRCATVVMSRE